MKKMKFITLLIFIFCISISAFSQRKFFKKSLKKGHTDDYSYVVNIPTGKFVELEDVMSYAEDNGYVIFDLSFQRISRFGNTARGVYGFSFLPKESVPKYIYHKFYVSIEGLPKYDKLMEKNRVKGFLFDNHTLTSGIYSDIYWTGSVKNGFADGDGMGMYLLDGIMYVFIGHFNNGLPYGKISVNYIQYSLNHRISKRYIYSYRINVGEFSENMANIYYNSTKMGFINNEGKLVIPFKYKKIVKGFQNGKAIVTTNKNNDIIIGLKGDSLDYSDRQKEVFRMAARAKRLRFLIKRDFIGIESVEVYNNKRFSIMAKLEEGSFLSENSETGETYGNNSFPKLSFDIQYKDKSSYDNSTNKQVKLMSANSNSSIRKFKTEKNRFSVEFTNDLTTKFKELKSNYMNMIISDNYSKPYVIDSINISNVISEVDKYNKEIIKRSEAKRKWFEERAKVFANIRKGDIIVYSPGFKYSVTERYLIFFSNTRTVYFKNLTYLVVDDIEKDRIKVIVNRTHSSGVKEKYVLNEYNGLKLSDGAIIYLDRFKTYLDERFHIYKP